MKWERRDQNPVKWERKVHNIKGKEDSQKIINSVLAAFKAGERQGLNLQE